MAKRKTFQGTLIKGDKGCRIAVVTEYLLVIGSEKDNHAGAASQKLENFSHGDPITLKGFVIPHEEGDAIDMAEPITRTGQLRQNGDSSAVDSPEGRFILIITGGADNPGAVATRRIRETRGCHDGSVITVTGRETTFQDEPAIDMDHWSCS